LDKNKRNSYILETSRKRIIDFIENQHIKPKDFLEKTGLKKGFIDRSHQDSGASDIFLSKILEVYPNISADWLLTGKEPMLKDSSPKDVFTEEVLSKKGIPMLPFDAFAGIGDSTVEGVNFETIEERYIVPLFDGIKVDFMLPVRGSSMYPKYSSGDVVACRLVTELLFVQWNKVYVIDSISQGVIMKRLLKGDNNEHLICRSDNKEYGEFPVPMTDIRSIALVVGVIRLD
jgi:repressor LexA